MLATIFKEQRPFLILFTLFLLMGGILLLIIEKGDAVLFFSANRTTFTNFFFVWTTRLGEAVPYLVSILLFLYLKKYIFAAAIPVVAVVVTLVAALSKRYFAHYRPATFFEELDLLDQIIFVENVYVNQGASSFPSGHTMSAFAIYFFLALSLPKHKIWNAIFFLLAFFVGLSRVYLVQHFLEDVYLGAIIGVLLGLLVFLFAEKVTLASVPNKYLKS
ncbi:MAG: phosphatase PAP2 family protein [Bacteroidota bacterium]